MATFTYTGIRQHDVAGVRRRKVGIITGGASYLAATGEVITAADLGLGVIEIFHLGNVRDGTNIYWPDIVYNAARTQITIFWMSATATAVGNGDLSGFTGTFEAVGK